MIKKLKPIRYQLEKFQFLRIKNNILLKLG
jgi:hypothetical protein